MIWTNIYCNDNQWLWCHGEQYIPINMHTVFSLLCFAVVIHWLIYPYPSGLLYWHCGNLMIAPVPAKQPWWIWINTSFEFIMNDHKTTTKQSTTKPCAYFLGYTVSSSDHNEIQHAQWMLVQWGIRKCKCLAKYPHTCQAGFPHVLETLKSPEISKLDSRAWKSPGIL